MASLSHNTFGFIALRPTALWPILSVLSCRIGQRWEATRAPRQWPNGTGGNPLGCLLLVAAGGPKSDKSSRDISSLVVTIQPLFWDESHILYIDALVTGIIVGQAPEAIIPGVFG